VSGTHGKTTTTAMLAWIFEVAGGHPTSCQWHCGEFRQELSAGRGRLILEGMNTTVPIGIKPQSFSLPA
jgi:UDP-N-acetylmuramate-alanine ligase